jgi:CRP-like cAMP-binding protein
VSLLDVGKLALITVTPTLIGAAVVYSPRWWAALVKVWPHRAAEEAQPVGPPIEQLAADLRRLLRLHEELTRSAHIAMLAHRLWAVEAAIGTRAVEAARALGVPHREPAQLEMLTRGELTRLLQELSRAGLVLPSPVGPFTMDGRF